MTFKQWRNNEQLCASGTDGLASRIEFFAAALSKTIPVSRIDSKSAFLHIVDITTEQYKNVLLYIYIVNIKRLRHRNRVYVNGHNCIRKIISSIKEKQRNAELIYIINLNLSAVKCIFLQLV